MKIRCEYKKLVPLQYLQKNVERNGQRELERFDQYIAIHKEPNLFASLSLGQE